MGNVEKNATGPRPTGGSEEWRAAGNEWAPIIQPLGGCLPTFLAVCGVLASAVLCIGGFSLLNTRYSGPSSIIYDDRNFYTGWCLVAMALFFGPLLFGIAGILRRLNREKPDSRQEAKSPSGDPTNPNLSPCPECGHYVSRLAKTCPKCGQPVALTPERPSGAGGS
jgi:ribosomal protein L32